MINNSVHCLQKYQYKVSENSQNNCSDMDQNGSTKAQNIKIFRGAYGAPHPPPNPQTVLGLSVPITLEKCPLLCGARGTSLMHLIFNPNPCSCIVSLMGLTISHEQLDDSIHIWNAATQ